MDWGALISAGVVSEDGGESASLSVPLVRRAWNEVVDAHTALAMRDYHRCHECLRQGLERAAEAAAAHAGYSRGPAWRPDTGAELCARLFGDVAARAFRELRESETALRDIGGSNSAADAAAHRGVDAASALIALIETRVRCG